MEGDHMGILSAVVFLYSQVVVCWAHHRHANFECWFIGVGLLVGQEVAAVDCGVQALVRLQWSV